MDQTLTGNIEGAMDSDGDHARRYTTRLTTQVGVDVGELLARNGFAKQSET